VSLSAITHRSKVLTSKGFVEFNKLKVWFTDSRLYLGNSALLALPNVGWLLYHIGFSPSVANPPESLAETRSPKTFANRSARFALSLFHFAYPFRIRPASSEVLWVLPLTHTRTLALLLAFVIVLLAFAFAFAFALVYLVQCVQLRPGFISCRYPLLQRWSKRFQFEVLSAFELLQIKTELCVRTGHISLAISGWCSVE